jgi:hypothetical protein
MLDNCSYPQDYTLHGKEAVVVMYGVFWDIIDLLL